jgi:hypothetical protein
MASAADPDGGPSFMDLAKAGQARLQVMNMNTLFSCLCFQNFAATFERCVDHSHHPHLQRIVPSKPPTLFALL